MMGDPNDENAADEVYNQILGEIGMSVNGDMATNSNDIANPAAAQQVSLFALSCSLLTSLFLLTERRRLRLECKTRGSQRLVNQTSNLSTILVQKILLLLYLLF